MNKLNIAIDGPAGAGKSTIARKVAQQLGYIYVDTGAMYRAVTWKINQLGGISVVEPTLTQWIEHIHIDILPGKEEQQVYLDGEDVTTYLRSDEVTSQVSYVASLPAVRKKLVAEQQKMAAQKGIVMDGRDIGTKVIPDAEIKLFLTASSRERAKRRLQDLQARGESTKSLDDIEKDIATRDQMDEQRIESPLIQAEDALLIDSSYMSIDEVVEYILSLSHTALRRGK